MKTGNRDNFSSNIISILKQRAAFICSNPDCKCLTIAPSKTDPEKVEFNGVASHICSAAPGGPRYNSEMTPEERSGIKNGIFLCSNCSVLIDKNNGIDYSESTLINWKLNHENWVASNLNKKLLDNKSTTINVVSHNQIGGITAGVVNVGEPQRKLTPRLKAETDKMFPDNNENISVSYVSGNTEALNFATEIKDYLISKGFTIKGLGSFQRSPEVFGLAIENSRHENGRCILVGYPKK
ncbi:hypothetical protein M0G43_13505 [Subsaxibacter sp. CAU 1640]|uniref:hypothetical protein n=1 Tax=Subsaxibacter sp. CAU 1640 TaxID=2933271 RepID=UPI0020033DB9|nr:hypothetical protein [Subsaxibacter sp. CAU 1640]MCK7591598.1 hypothetical protein [Subsaxibacter sp. CAU 1640]